MSPVTSKIKPQVVLVILIIVISIGAAAYFQNQYARTQKELQSLKADPTAIKQKEIKAVKSSVAALVALPEGEEPTIATIVDVEKLKSQPFFAKASNGDKLLIYPKAGKAYLYDPRANKLIDVAPVNIGTPSAALASPAPNR